MTLRFAAVVVIQEGFIQEQLSRGGKGLEGNCPGRNFMGGQFYGGPVVQEELSLNRFVTSYQINLGNTANQNSSL